MAQSTISGTSPHTDNLELSQTHATQLARIVEQFSRRPTEPRPLLSKILQAPLIRQFKIQTFCSRSDSIWSLRLAFSFLEMERDIGSMSGSLSGSKTPTATGFCSTMTAIRELIK